MPPFGDGNMFNQKREAGPLEVREAAAQPSDEGFLLIFDTPTPTPSQSPTSHPKADPIVHNIYTGPPPDFDFDGPQPTNPPQWGDNDDGDGRPWNSDDGRPHRHSWAPWDDDRNHHHDMEPVTVTTTEVIPALPYKDWDNSQTQSYDISSSPLPTTTGPSINQATPTYDINGNLITTTESTVTDFSGTTTVETRTYTTDMYAGTSVPQADQQSPFPRPHGPPHSPLKLILIGAFLGAALVMLLVGCVFCIRKMRKKGKRLRRAQADSRDAEGGPNMSMSDVTTPLTSAMVPSARTARPEYTHREGSISDEPPIIINPFNDPTYNSSSGLDDYIVGSPAAADIGMINPFAHPENPFTDSDDEEDQVTQCANLLRPNSDGDFPPEYMTIDDEHVAGMGTRESRFPFGDEALSDVGSTAAGPINAGGGLGGFGDGFRGYVPHSGGLGAEIGEGMGEGFSGHIPDSDTATLTDTSSEIRSTMDLGSIRNGYNPRNTMSIQDAGSVRESMIEYPQIRLSQELEPTILESTPYDGVADGFGYGPGMHG